MSDRVADAYFFKARQRVTKRLSSTQVERHKYTNTQVQAPIQVGRVLIIHKYTSTNTKIHKYKYILRPIPVGRVPRKSSVAPNKLFPTTAS